MPIYEFTCLVCDKTISMTLGLNDSQNLTCPECGEIMKRSYSFGAVTFNGSGFYATDKNK
jgi:putative FmdB family regulatory protein